MDLKGLYAGLLLGGSFSTDRMQCPHHVRKRATRMQRPFLDLSMQVNDTAVFSDRCFMEYLYDSLGGSRRRLKLAFEPGESLHEVVEHASMLEAGVFSRVFSGKDWENILEESYESLQLRYTGRRLELRGSDVYRSAVEELSHDLGLNGAFVNFMLRDYERVRDLFGMPGLEEQPALINVPFSRDELKIIESECGVIGLRDPYESGRTYVSGYFEYCPIDRFLMGMRLLEQTKPDARYQRVDLDHELLEQRITSLMEAAWEDPSAMSRLAALADALGVDSGEGYYDGLAILHGYTNYVSSIEFTCHQEDVLVNTLDMPHLPSCGRILGICGIQPRGNIAENSFSIARFAESSYHDLVFRVSLREPSMLGVQNALLSYLDVDFR
ncbi:MAG: hypothetical protein ACQESG_06080 [Nanobdellota archaeon]